MNGLGGREGPLFLGVGAGEAEGLEEEQQGGGAVVGEGAAGVEGIGEAVGGVGGGLVTEGEAEGAGDKVPVGVAGGADSVEAATSRHGDELGAPIGAFGEFLRARGQPQPRHIFGADRGVRRQGIAKGAIKHGKEERGLGLVAKERYGTREHAVFGAEAQQKFHVGDAVAVDEAEAEEVLNEVVADILVGLTSFARKPESLQRSLLLVRKKGLDGCWGSRFDHLSGGHSGEVR